jgi:hypothetical protein
MKFSSVGAFKWISVMVIVLIVAAAIGCGKKADQAPTPTPTAVSSPTATAPAEPMGETGTLSSVTGDVEVQRQGAGSWIVATSGMKIGTGDNLKTGEDGYVLITFFDGSVMEVEADSEISVEELSQASGGSTTVRITQVIGHTINRVEDLIDSSSTYEIETPAGSAVVRGTIEDIHVYASGRTCTGVVDEQDVTQHSASFTGSGVTVAIVEGWMVCCEEGGIPGSLFPIDPADDPLQYSSGGSCYGYGCGGSQPTPVPSPTGQH